MPLSFYITITSQDSELFLSLSVSCLKTFIDKSSYCYKRTIPTNLYGTCTLHVERGKSKFGAV
jgi:hypothetical protein